MGDEMFRALVGELLVDVPWRVNMVSRRDRLNEVEAKHESRVLEPKAVHGGVVCGCLVRLGRQHWGCARRTWRSLRGAVTKVVSVGARKSTQSSEDVLVCTDTVGKLKRCLNLFDDRKAR